MWDKNKTFGFLKKIGSSPTPRTEAKQPAAGPLVEALGGPGNIENVEFVAGTRLRVSVKQVTLINEISLKTCGVIAMIRINEHLIHLLMGSSAAEQIKTFHSDKEK